MQAPTAKNAGLHQEYDRIPVPEDVPELGVRAGEEGVIRRLTYLHDTVFDFVQPVLGLVEAASWGLSLKKSC